MGSDTGNLRTLRISATGGSRTLVSILTSSSSAGAGSTRRLYAYYKRLYNNNISQFYKDIFNLNYGEYRRNYMM